MARRLKVLCFHPALAPYRVDFFNRLAERVSLDLVLLQRNLFTQRFDQRNLVGRLAVVPRYAWGFSLRQRVIPLDSLQHVRRTKPDVVVVYEASPVTLMMCVARMLHVGGRFRLWTVMDDAPNMIPARRGMRRAVRDWVLRHVDGVIVPSEAAANEYRKIVRSLDCAVVPIVHDTDVIRAHAGNVYAAAAEWRKKNLKDGCRALFFVGRLTAVKNLEWLVAQTERYDWPGNVRLFLVGDGEEAAALRGRAQQLGRHEGEQLQTFFAAADALVLCSQSETFGAVVAEALQWGTPVIVSDRVGARTLVNDHNGVVYPHDDSEAFRRGLEQVMAMGRGTNSLLPVSLAAAVDELVRQMEGGK